MKLRIEGNSIRLRLKRPEVDALHKDGEVQEVLGIGPAPDIPLRYAIATHEADTALVRHRDGELRVTIPAAWAKALVAADRIGWDAEILQQNGVFIQVLIEADLPCAHKDEDGKPPRAILPARDEP